MPSRTPSLGVIIPTLNESARLGATLKSVRDYFAERPFDLEIWLIDGQSRDGTAEIARDEARRDPRIRFIQDPVNEGKGSAVKEGMLRCRADLRLLYDADAATPIEEFEKLRGAIEEGFVIAIGSRALEKSDVLEHQPFYREIPGKFFGIWTRLWTGLRYSDTQCGFKLFTAAAADAIFEKTRLSGFAFDVEALYLADRLKLRTAEIGVNWRHVEPSRARVFVSGWRTFWDTALLGVRR
jgi:glycosyltransferase involved in cell wall biosynthesis